MRAGKKPADNWKRFVIAGADNSSRSAARLRVLKRLDVTPEQLATVPQITPLLEQADGGMKQVIAAMRLSRDTAIRTFLEKYDSIPNDSRMRVPVEGLVR